MSSEWLTNEQPNLPDEESEPVLDIPELTEKVHTYKPINIDFSNLMGTVFLGIISLILAFALLRSQRRIHDLATQLARSNKQSLRGSE